MAIARQLGMLARYRSHRCLSTGESVLYQTVAVLHEESCHVAGDVGGLLVVESRDGDDRRGGLLRFSAEASSVAPEVVDIEFAEERLYATRAVWLDASGRDIVILDAVRATVTVHNADVAQRWGLVVGEPFALAAYFPRGKPDPGARR